MDKLQEAQKKHEKQSAPGLENPDPSYQKSAPLKPNFGGSYNPSENPSFGTQGSFPIPGHGGPGFPSPDGSGNLVGPDHPGFNAHRPEATGLPGGLPPGGRVPGARFDPFGPPPPPGAYRGGHPDVDLPPPDRDFN
eukprot:TRINITY_DN3724_c0_g1_i1.p1 TRINITY_DN3724_c0_g1~~TRINITY_DN3724_c0_g1_i1.p1  ORF type:complete len:136 (+),score=17.26 TRINITY_DN3724_c0_g1_i1:15-422(+)